MRGCDWALSLWPGPLDTLPTPNTAKASLLFFISIIIILGSSGLPCNYQTITSLLRAYIYPVSPRPDRLSSTTTPTPLTTPHALQLHLYRHGHLHPSARVLGSPRCMSLYPSQPRTVWHSKRASSALIGPSSPTRLPPPSPKTPSQVSKLQCATAPRESRVVSRLFLSRSALQSRSRESDPSHSPWQMSMSRSTTLCKFTSSRAPSCLFLVLVSLSADRCVHRRFVAPPLSS